MDGDDTFEEFERVAMTGAAALSRAAEVLIRSAQDSKVRVAAETARATEDLQRRAEARTQAAERYYARAAEPGWVRAASADEVALAWKGAQQWGQVDAGRFDGWADALTDRIRAEYGFDPRETGSGLEARSRGCREQVEARQAGREAGRGADRGADRGAGRGADRGTGWGVSDEQAPGVSAGVEAGPRSAAVELGYDTAARRAATSAKLTAAGVSKPAREAKMVADHLNGTDPQAVTTATPPRRGRGPAGPQQTRSREHDRGR